MSGFFRDQDNGYKDLLKRVFGIDKPVITMGIHEKAGAASLANGKQLIDIAKINEFGTDDGHVPARSFIRAWFDGAEPQLRSELVSLMQEVVEGKKTKEQILNYLGAKGVSQIKARIDAQIAPPNAPSTIKKKGSSTPLIASHFMYQSVTYEVDPGTGAVVPPTTGESSAGESGGDKT